MPTIGSRVSSGGNLAAIALLLAGIVFASLNGAVMKLLTASLPVMMLIWGRYVAYLAVMLPIALYRHGLALFRPPRPLLQMARAAVLMTSTVLFVYALVRIPFADAVAIFYAYPFLMTGLSPLVLGERADRISCLGVVGGFVGVLAVMRPGIGGDPIATILALLSGALTAVFLLITRILARGGDAVIVSTYTALVSALALTAVVPFVWVAPGGWELAHFAVLGAATSLSHWLTVLAYGRAPATFLAPFTYAEIAVAVLFGLLFFGEWPDATAWAGMLMIVLSGVLVARAPWIAAAIARFRNRGGRDSGR